jgi:hypothetical protein
MVDFRRDRAGSNRSICDVCLFGRIERPSQKVTACFHLALPYSPEGQKYPVFGRGRGYFPWGRGYFYTNEVIIMWIKTECGTLVNLSRVTKICVEELDTSMIKNEGTPWGIIWYGDGMKGLIARHATQVEAEEALADFYCAWQIRSEMAGRN